MRKLLIIFSVILFSITISAQKKSFSISDLYKIKGVSAPQISPDGKQLAFSVTEYFLEKGKSNSEIYLMNSDGTNIRRMTNNKSADFSPLWSKDGKNILFLSTRKNGVQVWSIPINGGESKQVTDLSTGINDYLVFPLKGQYAISTDVFPEYGADDEGNKRINDDMENGPIQAHYAKSLLYRHWTTWKDGKRSHIIFLNDDNSPIDLTPGDFDAPAFSLGGRGYAFSPGGKELSYVSNHDKNEAETTNKDLWIVSVDGKNTKNITSKNKAYDGDPLYSPDGKYIAYRMQRIPNYESDRFLLVIYNRKTGNKTILTEQFDNWVDDFRWATDSKSIYFTGKVNTHTPIFNVNITSKKITKIIDVKTINSFEISPDGRWLYFSRRSINEPTEIWKSKTDGSSLQRLTFFNKKIEDEVDIRPAEVLWINSPSGKKVQTFLIKPHNFDPNKKYPFILNVHGGPQGMWADAFRGDWQVYPGAGYVLAFPNPHGSTGFGQDYTAEISGDWGGKVYQDIMAVTDSLAKLPYVDSERMGAMGWSYGGYMMMWLEGHTDRFKAIVSMMGVYDLTAMYGATEELWFPEWDLKGTPWTSDLYQKWSPNNFVQNFKTPCLVISGEKDFRVPYTLSLEFFTDLQKMNVPSELIIFKNDGHWPNYVKSMPLYYNANLYWFNKYLGGAKAPYDMEKMIRNQAFNK